MAITLLSLSYLVTSLQSGAPHDILGHFLCDRWICRDYPRVSWQTFLADLGYSLLAGTLVSVSIRRISSLSTAMPDDDRAHASDAHAAQGPPERIPEPISCSSP